MRRRSARLRTLLRRMWTPRRFRLLEAYAEDEIRGVLHSERGRAEMAELQREYVRWRRGDHHWQRPDQA